MRRYPLNLLLLIAVAAAALCAAPVVANAGVRTPLSTSGNTIVDAAGAPVVLQGERRLLYRYSAPQVLK